MIISDSIAEAMTAAQAGKKHLLYLTTNWMDITMWRSWLACGRLSVSNLLKIPVEGVVPTTNHLELFNGILKRKHLARWFYSGHRLRFDYLILLLCTQILPRIYNQQLIQSQYTIWLTERFKNPAGGKDLVQIQGQEKSEKRGKGAGICWWPEDDMCDQQARTIMSLQRVGWSPGADADTFTGHCLSSKSNEACYFLLMHRDGQASCTCLDFQEHGGALDALAVQKPPSMTSPTPTTSTSPPLVLSIPQTPSVSTFSEIQASVQDTTMLIVDEDSSSSSNGEEYTGDLESIAFEERFKPPSILSIHTGESKQRATPGNQRSNTSKNPA
ncbi:hypothetical protein PQX77_009260 [Marasmius sp. AFHP31]|nr:hypothetical protein PQX77_009260 [Marasmius sp. AFHP31]